MTTAMEKSCVATPATELVPRESGDFYYQAEPNPVVSTFGTSDSTKVLYDRDNLTIYRRPIQFDDGTKLDIAYSVLHTPQPEGLDGIAAYESTAWLTQPEGVYTKRLLHLGRLGVAGTVVGTPKNFGKFSSVSENGRNQLEVMQWMTQHLDLDPAHMMINGMSQGNMIGNAVVDIAEQFGVTPVYADGQAGCFPNKLDWQTVCDTIGKAPGEALVVADLLRLSPTAMMRLARSLDTSPSALYAHLQTMPGLLDGTTGKHYDRRPTDIFAHMALSEADCLAQTLQWIPKNINFPNESMRIHKGTGHVADCVNVPGHTAWGGRTRTVAEILVENPHIRTRLAGVALWDELRTQAIAQNPVFLNKPARPDQLASVA